jgi:predicted nucleic acid-binding protein
LTTFDVVPVTGEMLSHASGMTGHDFEDNVQIIAAYAAGVSFIISRDATGFRHSRTPVLTPSEFLESHP